MHPKRVKKFWVNDTCIGCGTCARICSRGNIMLQDKRPAFSTDCIGCLSCVQFCPKEAINVGRLTAKRECFPNPGREGHGSDKKAYPYQLIRVHP